MMYKVKATYTVVKEMRVKVREGGDPMTAADWEDIEYEHDVDCYLDDITGAEPDGDD